MDKIKQAKLATNHIRIDGGTQTREELNETVVAEYSEAMAAGATFPACVVFWDGANNWLADGFHRYYGAIKTKKTLLCEIRQGSKRDAILYGVGANGTHGLRRTNADKRKAVETLLEDAEWQKKSNVWIAEHCAVSDEFVRQLRASQVPTVGTSTETRTGKDGKQYPVSTAPASAQNFAADNAQNDDIEESTPDAFDDQTPESDADLQGYGEDGSTPVAPTPVAGIPVTEAASGDETENAVRALPIYLALSEYAHAGKLFFDQAMIWHEQNKTIRGARASLLHIRYTSGPVTDALKTLAAIGDPSEWQGCGTCKGSMRFGERNDPCSNCRGGFTVNTGQGVNADVIRSHANAAI